MNIKKEIRKIRDTLDEHQGEFIFIKRNIAANVGGIGDILQEHATKIYDLKRHKISIIEKRLSIIEKDIEALSNKINIKDPDLNGKIEQILSFARLAEPNIGRLFELVKMNMEAISLLKKDPIRDSLSRGWFGTQYSMVEVQS